MGGEQGLASRAPWRLALTLAVLVTVALAAAVGTGFWIAQSGDDARAREDASMLSIELGDRGTNVASAARHAAAAIDVMPRVDAERDIAAALDAVDPDLASARFFDYGLLLSPEDTLLGWRKRTKPKERDSHSSHNGASPVAMHGGDEPISIRAHGHSPIDGQLTAGRVPVEIRTAVSAMMAGEAHRYGKKGSAFILVDSQFYLISAARLARQTGDMATIVVVEHIDVELIDELAEGHSLADLMLSTSVPGEGRTSMPVLDASGETIGAFSWRRQTPVGSAFEEVVPLFGGLAVALIGLAGLACGQALVSHNRLSKSERNARRQASRDPLTDLLNRRAFLEHLTARCDPAGPSECAVLYIDLDGFKGINDTLGHEAGDQVLIAVGTALRSVVPEGAVLARLGGDEFAVLLTSGDPAEAEAFGQSVADAIRSHQVPRANSLTAEATIGIACAPRDGRTATELLRRADIALYAAKGRGRRQVVLFDTTMESDLRERKVIETDLRRALGTGQIQIAYQPIFAIDGAKVVGVEALVRWRHPERGAIPPSAFIAIAEDTGLIMELGEWVLREACKAGRRWPMLTVAVNISPVQMRSPNFVDGIASAIASSGIEPNRLVLEITEGVLMEQQEEALRIIAAIQALGVRVALDDFGTGYSSLAYLKKFPFDKLKIDRSFVESLDKSADHATIIHAIISLGRALRMTVVAEGVETAAQHRFLRAAGCHELQGFLFHQPCAQETIDALIANQFVAPVEQSRFFVA